MTSAVLTGAGAVLSAGSGLAALARALSSSTCRPAPADRSYAADGGARLAALTSDLDLSAWLPAAAARRMSPPSRFAVAAARMALEGAGLAGNAAAGAAVIMSTAFGPASYSERLFQSVLREGPESASPMLFAECVANAPAAQLAIACGASGPNVTIVQREAGPLFAVARAAQEVAEERVARALCGSVDEMPPVVYGMLDRLGALARDAGRGESARPFDKHRNGCLAGEGAVVIVAESEPEARARGAKPLARVRAWGKAFDATASRVGWGRGHARLGRALRRDLERSGVALRDVDCIVSGASGSIGGDRLEGLALREAWGAQPLPPVLAPKGVTGEYGGGFLAAALLAMEGAPFGPTAGFLEPDEEIGIRPHAGGPLSPPRLALLTSFAAGGAAGWLVLERP
jgi:3-oxoacyl-[acyl-carrier-protein] synthase II